MRETALGLALGLLVCAGSAHAADSTFMANFKTYCLAENGMTAAKANGFGPPSPELVKSLELESPPPGTEVMTKRVGDQAVLLVHFDDATALGVGNVGLPPSIQPSGCVVMVSPASKTIADELHAEFAKDSMVDESGRYLFEQRPDGRYPLDKAHPEVVTSGRARAMGALNYGQEWTGAMFIVIGRK